MDKFNSRKYILAMVVTLALIVLEGATFVYAFVNKDYSWAVDMAPFLIYIAAVYIGGNVAQDFSPKGKLNETARTPKTK